ncbi:Fc.00g052320.m01.CDS01 [Cosmosporella sp. VM-42]
MGAKAGLTLKCFQWFIRGVQFGCAALILAIYSYFLATLHNHNLPTSTSVRAVEGISGVAVLYTLCGLLLLCCVAGMTFTSFLAVLFDVAFIAAFIYVAVANKGGASSCDGYLDTPFGKGKAGDTADEGSGGFTALPSYRVACRLQSACLAVAIIAIFFFCFSILTEVALARHRHKEKRFGLGPQNDYTSGYGRKGFFSRLTRRNTVKETEDVSLPEHTTPDQLNDNRYSYGTERTAVNSDNAPYNKYDTGYGYEDGHGRNGYGPIHYPDPEPQTTGTATAYPPADYRYDDGVYDTRRV